MLLLKYDITKKEYVKDSVIQLKFERSNNKK